LKRSIIDSIKSLPPLSSTILEINRIYGDENSTIKDMAKAIESDPMIIANMLKIANSPLYGFGKEIKNANQAVSLFGMNMTRAIALGNSVKKLLNVDMQPYKITSEEFAQISLLQAALIFGWYKKIDRQKAEDLYLAAFLQETGKILIASEIIRDDEAVSFASEIENSNNIAIVEKAYFDATSGEVTALVFKHWGFDSDFIEMIQYSDNPLVAPESIREFSTALNIVKTIVSINKPFSEVSINFGLKKASDAGYNVTLLEEAIAKIVDNLNT
jgi:HD-like signal output (HDOD) protein